MPRDTEEGRALLQSRLARFGRLGTCLSAGSLVILGVTAFTVRLPGTEIATPLQVLSLVLSLAVAYLDRARPLRAQSLIAVDCVFTWAQASFFLGFGFAVPIYARPEFIQLCCISNLLAARAFLIPSSAWRTSLIGVLPMLGVIASTLWFYREGVPYPGAPSTTTYVVFIVICAISPLVISAMTSSTIFGLRQQARHALQLGQYTLLEKIGEGGMGVVYHARHATLRRPTAIKLLPAERAGEHSLQRFEREVQLTCQLTHPNTIAIFDYGRSADGILYYAMEYLDGLDLESLVQLDGPLSDARVAHVLLQVCGALGEAHERGLLHRDIKPQNILLCERGGTCDVAKVVDFGLVKELQRSSDAALSTTDALIGSPLYMSPEAITRPRELDARGDLYALGAVGYFLLTGTPPFRGATIVEICSLHLHARPDLPSLRAGRTVHAVLEALVLRCLEKDPLARPSSALELASELDALALPRWTRSDAAAWWHARRDQVAALKRERAERLDVGTPRATVAVDLRERGLVTPWQSAAPEQPDSRD